MHTEYRAIRLSRMSGIIRNGKPCAPVLMKSTDSSWSVVVNPIFFFSSYYPGDIIRVFVLSENIDFQHHPPLYTGKHSIFLVFHFSNL